MTTKYGQEVRRSGIVWTYACREVRGGSTHSEHSHPIALDINPPANPLKDDGVLRTDFGRFGIEDGVGFVNAFKEAGFRWGGDWSTDPSNTERVLRSNERKVRDGRVDPMHFEYVGPPARGGRPLLRRGDRGEWVGKLQRLLVERGLDPGPIDGVFGAKTEDAVKDFQGGASLGVDGVVGPGTWHALRRAPGARGVSWVLRWQRKPGASFQERVFYKFRELAAFMKSPRVRRAAQVAWERKAVEEEARRDG